jgi:Cyclic nucleotide-binding domain
MSCWVGGAQKTPPTSQTIRPFDAHAFLESAGAAKTIVQYARGEAIFTQGDPCAHVMYIQSGAVKLSALSESGKEAVIAMLGRQKGQADSRRSENLPGNACGDGRLHRVRRPASLESQRSAAERRPARTNVAWRCAMQDGACVPAVTE